MTFIVTPLSVAMEILSVDFFNLIDLYFEFLSFEFSFNCELLITEPGNCFVKVICLNPNSVIHFLGTVI